MNILKKRLNSFKKNYDLTESSVKFYNNTKKRFFRKAGIVSTCIVCVFAPINSNYTEVKALTGVEEVAIAGVLGILALCGIGVAQDATDGLAEMADNFVKGYKDFGSALADNVKDKWDTLLATATATGSVALDLFNDLTVELSNFMGNIWNSFSGGNIDNSNLANLVMGTGVGALSLSNFGSNATSILDALKEFPYFMQLGNVVMLCKSAKDFALSIRDDGGLLVGYNSTAMDMKIFYLDGFNRFGSSLYRMTFYKDNYGFDASSVSSIIFGSALSQCSMYFLGEHYTYIGGSWHKGYGDSGLVLDPPAKTFPDLKLLDQSYINYGDILDVALPRYVGPNATVVDGVVTYPGTWAIPNQYNPYAPNYKPIPLPFPLPDVGTVDGTYVGDITTDTPWTNTTDKDITGKPDYIPPTIGDFLGDTDVPGKLNWKEYFPFCLPYDLIKFLGVLAAEPQTPKFSFDYDLFGYKGTVDIDLEEFNGVASVCRTMFNLVFIIGLIFITRKQIGA